MTFPLLHLKQNAASRLATVSDAPESEARWLLAQVIGFDPYQPGRPDSSLNATQHAEFERLLSRRLTGEPLAYVLGTQPFWTLDLTVTPAVLIPRVDTELVVERALQHLPPHLPAQIADLGTGSGAIALALASERPTAQILAIDISAEALAVAQHNAARIGLKNVRCHRGHWLRDNNECFDLIVSNPPYIAVGDPHLTADVQRHEPSLALFAGEDGLDAIRAIVATAPPHLNPGGWLILEHGWQQASATQQLLELAGFVSVASHADMAGHLRVTEGQWR